MININNKSWDNLSFEDIEQILSENNEENFFFEFKSDDESPAKLAKEISAFSNTYGGYILLGVNDDKTIGGCTIWNEQRIHTTIHDSITPTPNFDVKKLESDNKVILIIKIEEGTMPPYITNRGLIYERVSSGSFPIKDSSKLSQLYYKKEQQYIKLKNKIEIEDVNTDAVCPSNFCGYVDLGFSITCSEGTNLQKNFYDINFEQITEYLRTLNNPFGIMRLGHSYLITIGRFSASNSKGNEVMLNAGINNFIEIMHDGSVKYRVALCSIPNQSKVDICNILLINIAFTKIYSMIIGENFSDIFIYAHKYEKLTVLKQFIPFFDSEKFNNEGNKALYNYYNSHHEKYGNSIIICGNRIPENDYTLIDKRLFKTYDIEYNNENLISELFHTSYFDLGYVGIPK